MFVQFGSLLLLLIVVSFLFSAIWVFREYERGVVFFLGAVPESSRAGLGSDHSGNPKGSAR